MSEHPKIRHAVSLRPFTTLRAGGPAEQLIEARTLDELGAACAWAQGQSLSMTVLGSGSNILPSDDGVAGLTILNRASRIDIRPHGNVIAETGCSFQELFQNGAGRTAGAAVRRGHPRDAWRRAR